MPRSYLGLKLKPLPDDRPGCVVELVLPGSPAAQAELRPGDELREVNGQRLRRFEELPRAVRGAQVGSPVRLRLRRGTHTVPRR